MDPCCPPLCGGGNPSFRSARQLARWSVRRGGPAAAPLPEPAALPLPRQLPTALCFPLAGARLSLGGRCGARYPGRRPVTAPHVTPGAINSGPGRICRAGAAGGRAPRVSGAARPARPAHGGGGEPSGAGEPGGGAGGTLRTLGDPAPPRGGSTLVSGWEAPLTPGSRRALSPSGGPSLPISVLPQSWEATAPKPSATSPIIRGSHVRKDPFLSEVRMIQTP